MNTIWPAIALHVSQCTSSDFSVRHQHPASGGCINRAVVIEDHKQRYFVKLNHADRLDMFVAEAAGLSEIAKSNTIRVPEPICWGSHADMSYLVLEYLDIGAAAVVGSDEKLGQQLAAMHQYHAKHYGWRLDNTIGSTPQINTPCKDWSEFWRHRRLGVQLKLAAENGYTGSLQRHGEQLLAYISVFFRGYEPTPSLLHGDLWSGNYGVAQRGVPVIFDPAVYYGDRETDLAMTELFGGFPPRFYQAYHEAYPLDSGYNMRKNIYNLYHILNHLNLFGGSYLSQAEDMMANILSYTN